MIKATIYIETINQKMAWVLNLTFEKNGEKFNKKIKDIIESKNEMNEPFHALIKTLKSPQEITLYSNYKYIIDLAEKDTSEHKITGILERDKSFYEQIDSDLVEVKKEIEIQYPNVPEYIKVRLEDLKNKFEDPNDFNINIAISMALLKIAGYFADKNDEVYEFPLFKDLKAEGYIPKEYEVEDVLMTVIESYE